MDGEAMTAPTINPERADALLSVLLMAIACLSAKVDEPPPPSDTASIADMQEWVLKVLRVVGERMDQKATQT